MSPVVDKDLIQRALDVGVELEDLKNNMGQSDLMDFENNLRSEMGWHSEGSEEEILEGSHDGQNDGGPSEELEGELLEDNPDDQAGSDGSPGEFEEEMVENEGVNELGL